MSNNKEGFELAEKLGDYVNTYSIREKGKQFIEGFDGQHRTLQQSSFRLILELIEHMGSENYRTDGRNEQSKKVAKMLLKGFESEYQKELISQGVSEERAKEYTGIDFLPSKFLRNI